MFKTIAQLEAEIKTGLDRVTAIAAIAKEENREYTAQEKTEIDALTGEKGTVLSLQSDLAREKQIAAMALKHGSARIDAGLNIDANLPRTKLPARAKVTGVLKAFKGPNASEDAYRSGRFLMAVAKKDERSIQWCRDAGMDVRAAMGENDDLKGGVLVNPEFENAIINLKESYGVFGRYCRNYPMSSDTVLIPRRLSGLTAYAVGENSEITASDAALNQVSLNARKWGTLTKISSELDEDSVSAIADFVANEIAYAHAVKEDSCGFLGDGTATYNGIVGLASGLLAGSVSTAAAGQITAAGLTIAVFQDAVGKLPEFPGIMPAWFVHKAVFHNVMGRLQVAAGGNNVVDLGNGPVMQFLGYPVVFTQTLPSTIAASTKFAYFGDLSMAATKGNRRGVSIAADASRFFEYDQIAIRSTLRYDINVHETGTASVAGPIVQLATPGA